MGEMVERVARGLHAEYCRRAVLHGWTVVLSVNYDDLVDSAKADYRATARAAIAAMRKPTEQMYSAGDNMFDHLVNEPHPHEISDCLPVWQAMIDAALA